jgi:hypothetical protein
METAGDGRRRFVTSVDRPNASYIGGFGSHMAAFALGIPGFASRIPAFVLFMRQLLPFMRAIDSRIRAVIVNRRFARLLALGGAAVDRSLLSRTGPPPRAVLTRPRWGEASCCEF